MSGVENVFRMQEAFVLIGADVRVEIGQLRKKCVSVLRFVEVTEQGHGLKALFRLRLAATLLRQNVSPRELQRDRWSFQQPFRLIMNLSDACLVMFTVGC